MLAKSAVIVMLGAGVAVSALAQGPRHDPAPDLFPKSVINKPRSGIDQPPPPKADRPSYSSTVEKLRDAHDRSPVGLGKRPDGGPQVEIRGHLQ